MRIHRRDVILLGHSNSFLSLDNVDSRRHACREPVPCLSNCFLSKGSIAFSDADLFGGCGDSKKRGANLEVHAPTSVLEFGFALREDGIRRCNVSLDAATAPDRKVDSCDSGKPTIRLCRIYAGGEISSI